MFVCGSVTWYDSGCDPKMAAGAAVDAVTLHDADVIIGPPCSAGRKLIIFLNRLLLVIDIRVCIKSRQGESHIQGEIWFFLNIEKFE